MPNSVPTGSGSSRADHGDRDRDRMAGAQRTHDDVDGVGKPRGERSVAALAFEDEHREREDDRRRRRCNRRFREIDAPGEDPDEDDEPACDHGAERARDAHLDARLDDEPIEPRDRQERVAVRRQAALAPQLDEHLLPVAAPSPTICRRRLTRLR